MILVVLIEIETRESVILPFLALNYPMAKMLVSIWHDVFKTGLVKLEFVARTTMKGLNTVI